MSRLTTALSGTQRLFVRQRRELVEIVLAFESANQYEVLDENKVPLGMVAEQGRGFRAALWRNVLGSHRGLAATVVDESGTPFFHISRPFFWFFSTLEVRGADGILLGSVHRRFGFFYKKYDLHDASGQTFATIRSPLWRLWTFPVTCARSSQPAGQVAKKWGGALREIFSDADTFMVEFSGAASAWKLPQRVVMFGAAISIDFDFFEQNSNSGVLVDLAGG